jgi:mRNA-degrading endonuclease toxin of MazEF toxin-antitoxin module
MKRGKIWLVSLDPTPGHEQEGRRPVLIVSPEAFNRITKLPVILPIASVGNFVRTAGFAYR